MSSLGSMYGMYRQGAQASWGAVWWLREPTSDSASASGPASMDPDFDGIWKEVLQSWLPECLALFWPSIHDQINWSTQPVFLHPELQRLHRIMKRGAKRTDLLVQVLLKQGGPALLLMHLEVESGPDMESYTHGGFGDTLTFKFPVVNLASWQARVAELEALAPGNPFAVIVLAQLTCRATRPDETRLVSKLELARVLSHWNHNADVRGAVFRVIDSLLRLPPALDDRFIEVLEQSEEPAMLQQLSCIDRYLLRKEHAAGKEEGFQEGKLEGNAGLLQSLLMHRFGLLPDWASSQLAQADVDTLRRWAVKVLDAERLEDVFKG